VHAEGGAALVPGGLALAATGNCLDNTTSIARPVGASGLPQAGDPAARRRTGPPAGRHRDNDCRAPAPNRGRPAPCRWAGRRAARAVMRKPCIQPMAGALHASSSMDSEPSDQELIDRLRRSAHACEATGELWGQAWARWLRTMIILAARHDPRFREIHRTVHRAVDREDWEAVLAICNEHAPSPWGRR
jgi:hypothetical protein